MEYIIPWQVDAYLLAEHLARYKFASQFISKRVLDLGCGCGYGAEILSGKADVLISLDLNLKALQIGEQYSAFTRFVSGNALRLPFRASVFDSVVALEVIEHLCYPVQMLKETKRVLKDAGCLILSTPNKPYYQNENPFHVHEFSYDELVALLHQFFKNVVIWSEAVSPHFYATFSTSSPWTHRYIISVASDVEFSYESDYYFTNFAP